MELFKVCEKETKTKAYSKEGLAKAERLDPEEQAKDDARQFLDGNVEKLSVQIEALEADVEKLNGGKKNKNKDEILRKQGVIVRHRWHIAKMEQMVRMIDNDGKCVCVEREGFDDRLTMTCIHVF
jgi:CCR4-NOT transcription complex subunit 3